MDKSPGGQIFIGYGKKYMSYFIYVPIFAGEINV